MEQSFSDLSTFGVIFKRLLGKYRVAQAEVARQANVSRAFVSRALQDGNVPSPVLIRTTERLLRSKGATEDEIQAMTLSKAAVTVRVDISCVPPAERWRITSLVEALSTSRRHHEPR